MHSESNKTCEVTTGCRYAVVACVSLLQKALCISVSIYSQNIIIIFIFTIHFFVLGKEYVCIVRLHEAVEKEDDLAKVSVNN